MTGDNHEIDPHTLERDDTEIATALKWSLVVFVLLAGVGGGIAFRFFRVPPVVVAPPPPPPAPLPPKTRMETPEIRFTDITA